jgi:hypothetical protein
MPWQFFLWPNYGRLSGQSVPVPPPLVLPFVAFVLPIRYVPIIAGSAVGRKASSKSSVKARGQFQTFDTVAGVVKNQARFEVREELVAWCAWQGGKG